MNCYIKLKMHVVISEVLITTLYIRDITDVFTTLRPKKGGR